MPKDIVVIGSGYWGKNLVRNFHELGALRGVCDINDAALAAARERFAGLRAYAEPGGVFADPAVRAVAVATPAATHFALARAALLAGKDVFVEKPLALSSAEGEALIAAARSGGRILMVGHILDYHPAVETLKRMIDAGELGKIRYVYSSRLNLGRIRTEENILWSFAPHDISVLLLLLGEMPSEVVARGGTYLSPGVPDVTVTALAFPGGTRAHIFVSWLHPFKQQRLVVVGERKMAVFDDVGPGPKLVAHDYEIDWVAGRPVSHPEKPAPIAVDATEPLKLECRHFLECLASRATPRTDGGKGLAVLRVLEACERSLKEGA